MYASDEYNYMYKILLLRLNSACKSVYTSIINVLKFHVCNLWSYEISD